MSGMCHGRVIDTAVIGFFPALIIIIFLNPRKNEGGKKLRKAERGLLLKEYFLSAVQLKKLLEHFTEVKQLMTIYGRSP